MKNSKRIFALLMAFVMMFSLTGCTIVDIDFMLNGWDGVVNGEVVWENPKRNQQQIAEDEKAKEEADAQEEEEEDAQTEDVEEVTEVVTEVNDKGETVTKVVTVTKPASTGNKTPANKPSNSGSNSGSQTQSTTKPNGSTTNTTTKASGNSPAAPTTAEIINTYKTAANKIKSNTSGVTCTRTREKYIELGGNISGLSASIVKSAFSEKDDTKAKTVTGSSIANDFIVEKQSYVCNLTEADVKSATMTQSGNNTLIVIKVKDDTDQAQGHSNKAVSAKAVADLAVNLSVGKLKYMACKDVYLEATINSKGQLINLHTYMPAYFYATDEYFAVALEQWWTISYT
ncbi:MAG: hypothetical protein MJ143_04905 [Clostridia bacterium]|nr:hypothetical protein [Clostridia bacterium]